MTTRIENLRDRNKARETARAAAEYAVDACDEAERARLAANQRTGDLMRAGAPAPAIIAALAVEAAAAHIAAEYATAAEYNFRVAAEHSVEIAAILHATTSSASVAQRAVADKADALAARRVMLAAVEVATNTNRARIDLQNRTESERGKGK